MKFIKKKERHFLLYILIILSSFWIITFPSKGFLYQLSLYSIPVLVLYIKNLRRNIFKYFKNYGFYLFIIFILPVIFSDFLNFLLTKLFYGELDTIFEMSWRLIIFPISIAALLLNLDVSVKKLVFILPLLFSLHSLAGLVEYFPHLAYVDALRWTGRMNGFTFNPNVFGLLMAFTFVLAFYGSLRSQGRVELVIYLVEMALFLVCCILSGSRGSLLAMLAGVVVLLLTDRKKVIYFSSILILITLFAYSLDMFDTLKYRFSKFFVSDERLLLLNEYFNEILQKIVVGYGSSPISLVGPDSPVTAVGPHNIFVETLYRTGLVGLVLLLAFIYCLCKKYWHNRQESPAIVLSACLLVAGLFDHSIYKSIIYQSLFAIIFIFILIDNAHDEVFVPGEKDIAQG